MANKIQFNPIDILLGVAHDNHRPAEVALTDFLDYAIDVFAVEKYQTHDSMQSILTEARDKCTPYFIVMLHWLTEVDKAMQNGRWHDFFGETYEKMFQAKSKASMMGQFFTPQSVSDLLAGITVGKDENNASESVYDGCCGSGRLLLSHYMKHATPQHHGRVVGYYVAQDIDPVSCKMCALNFMAHGMVGEVRCQDTLLMTPPSMSYFINEVRSPFPTPYYSIRKVG